MTVKQISGGRHFTGLSTDTKPTPSADKVTIGSTFFESDSGLRYEYTDDGWAVDANSLNGSKVSAENSSSVALIADAIFTGEAVDITDVAMITVSLKSDVASATDGLSIQQSIDGTNWDHIDPYTVPANTGKTYTINKIAQYFRIVYTNGSAPQTFFRMQILLNFVNGLSSSHRINDDITSEDDATLGIAVIKVPTNDDVTLKNVDVQNPFPTDGDSVYAKDLNLTFSTIGTFDGILDTLFNDYNAENSDITATNPKTFTIRFRRPVTNSQVGIGSRTGNFSNVKIQMKDLAGTVRAEVDQSADDTKYTANVYNFEPTTYIEIVVEFHTADPVKVSGMYVPKDISSLARIQAVSDFSGLVESINSFRGAMNVTQALVHKVGISTKFHRTDGVSTTLSAPISAGAISFTVTSAVGLVINDMVQIVTGNPTGEIFVKIINLVGTTITPDMPIPFDIASGAVVDKIETNLGSSIGSLASPILYNIHPPAGAIWQITRIIIAINATTTMDDGKFGGITALANGFVLRNNLVAGLDNQTNWKTNGDLALDMFDVSYTDKAPAGTNGLRGRWTFTKGEFVVELNGDDGDSLEFLCQDDATANTNFEVKAQGRLFGG